MTRPIILHSGSWADVPLDELTGLSAEWGYQGFELSKKPVMIKSRHSEETAG